MGEDLRNTLLEFDKVKLEQLVLEMISKKSTIDEIFSILSKILSDLGDEWANGDIALSQIYMSSKICEEVLDKILPVKTSESDNFATIAIVTLMDYHVLGKKIVYSVMRASGINIKDFGNYNSIKDLIEKTITNKIEILLISTLMYHSALKIKEVSDSFKERNYKVKILVGGAPFIFDPELWKQVEADAMGITASEGIRIINEWIGEKQL